MKKAELSIKKLEFERYLSDFVVTTIKNEMKEEPRLENNEKWPRNGNTRTCFDKREVDQYTIHLACFEKEESASQMKEVLEKQIHDITGKKVQITCQLEKIKKEEEENCRWLLSLCLGNFFPKHKDKKPYICTNECVTVNEKTDFPEDFFIDRSITYK